MAAECDSALREAVVLIILSPVGGRVLASSKHSESVVLHYSLGGSRSTFFSSSFFRFFSAPPRTASFKGRGSSVVSAASPAHVHRVYTVVKQQPNRRPSSVVVDDPRPLLSRSLDPRPFPRLAAAVLHSRRPVDMNPFTELLHRVALLVLTPKCYEVFFYDLDFFNGKCVTIIIIVAVVCERTPNKISHQIQC